MAAPTHDEESPISGINVTPLVDVVLVLLVVLMVTAGYVARRALPIELPSPSGPPAAAQVALEVVVEANGRASVDGVPMDADALRSAAAAYAARTPPDARRAVVSADRMATHGSVVAVLDAMRGAEIGRVAVRVRRTP